MQNNINREELLKKKAKMARKQKIKKNMVAYAIMLPSLLLFAFFVWSPIFTNLGLSFFSDYSFSEFVGFENYKYVFEDELFLSALRNTFEYIFWSLVIGFLVPFLLGFLLSECFHAKGFFRICIYVPCMISGIAVVFLFLNIYGDGSYDILNVILKAFGAEERLWRSDTKIIIPLIVIAMTWRGAGSTSLIYLSNFQQIDTSYYEAARLDGASPLQRFLKVTVPQMKSTLMTLFILQIISVFQVFYEPLVLGETGIGPLAHASMSLMLLSYQYAFMDFEVAYGAAVSVILTVIILVFTVLYFIVNKYVNKGEK